MDEDDQKLNLQLLRIKFKEELKRRTKGSFWTRTKLFRRLCKWAFRMCDQSRTGRLTSEELYSSILLLYLNLAKYTGPAACFPPSREVVDMLFDACDDDNSGDICEKEFVAIIVILSSQLTWRILTYYLFLIILVPYIIRWTLAILYFLRVDHIVLNLDKVFDACAPSTLQYIASFIPESLWAQIPRSIVSFLIFSFVIPYCWDRMDEYFKQCAEKNTTNYDDDTSNDAGPIKEKKDEKID